MNLFHKFIMHFHVRHSSSRIIDWSIYYLDSLHAYRLPGKEETKIYWISMEKRACLCIWLMKNPLTVHFSNFNWWSVKSYLCREKNGKQNLWCLVFGWSSTYLPPGSETKWDHKQKFSFIFAGISSDLMNSSSTLKVTWSLLRYWNEALKTFFSMYFAIF